MPDTIIPVFYFSVTNYFVIAVVNIFISIPLIKVFGVVGAAMGTAIALVAGNVIFINWYYQRKIKLDMFYFWENILKAVPSVAVPCGLGIIVMRFFKMESVAQLLLFVIMYTAIYIGSIWLLGFNDYEKSIIRGMTNRLKKRKI